MGPGTLPPLKAYPRGGRATQPSITRPQENVRQFLDFQRPHLNALASS